MIFIIVRATRLTSCFVCSQAILRGCQLPPRRLRLRQAIRTVHTVRRGSHPAKHRRGAAAAGRCGQLPRHAHRRVALHRRGGRLRLFANRGVRQRQESSQAGEPAGQDRRRARERRGPWPGAFPC